MTTLMMFNQCEGCDDFGPVFFIEFQDFEGDLSYLDGTWINISDDPEKVRHLSQLLYDEEGNFKVKRLREPTKDWDTFISCGFAL